MIWMYLVGIHNRNVKRITFNLFVVEMYRCWVQFLLSDLYDQLAMSGRLTQLPAGSQNFKLAFIEVRHMDLKTASNGHKEIHDMTLLATWKVIVFQDSPTKNLMHYDFTANFCNSMRSYWGLSEWVLLVRSLMILSDNCWRSVARQCWISIGTDTPKLPSLY